MDVTGSQTLDLNNTTKSRAMPAGRGSAEHDAPRSQCPPECSSAARLPLGTARRGGWGFLLACATIAGALLALTACGGGGGMQSPPGASPATDPPATDPPATDPPATDPPATDPPATDPPPTPGVVVTPTSLSVSEGDGGSYTVVLESPPTDTVTVGIEGMSGTVRVSPSSLSFSTQNWNQARTVTVTAKVDTDTVHDTVTLTHTATGGGYGSVSIESVTVTVQDVYPGLTAQFTDLPTVHDRGPSFTFGLEFNREVDTSPTSIRDDVLDVTGGTVTAATRVDSSSNRRWRITVMPDSGDDLVIVLPATRACTDAGAICTPDGLALSMPLEQTVACGLLRVTVTPASLEVVDGGGAYWVGRYSVALDRKPDSSMTITVSGTDGRNGPLGLTVAPDVYEIEVVPVAMGGVDNARGRRRRDGRDGDADAQRHRRRPLLGGDTGRHRHRARDLRPRSPGRGHPFGGRKCGIGRPGGDLPRERERGWPG